MADENYARLGCVGCAAPISVSLKLNGQPRKNQRTTCGSGCAQKIRRRERGTYLGTIRQCVRCNAKYEPKHRISMYCTKTCKRVAWNRKKDPAYGTRAITKSHARAIAVGIRKSARAVRSADTYMRAELRLLRLLARPCAVCSEPLMRDGHGTMCSDACAEVSFRNKKRAARMARKALERAASVDIVDPIRVFWRDGWRCYLCGCATPKAKRGTYDDDAPELEHVVPLSKGGAHSYANCRCACRACNLIKGDCDLESIGGAYIGAGDRTETVRTDS